MCNKLTVRCTKTHDRTPINDCCKRHILELLDYVTGTLEHNNIEYWLDYGTLLGATRGKKQIAWDDDADISIHMEDEHKVIELLQANQYGYVLYANPEIAKKPSFPGLRFSIVNKIHIDIFPWKEDAGFMCRRNYLDDGPISPDAKKGKRFPVEFIKPLSRIEFEGKLYWAPHNPVEFCKMRYGKAWNTPLTVADWNTTINSEKNTIYKW